MPLQKLNHKAIITFLGTIETREDKLSRLRNNLAHANSGEQRQNIGNEVKQLLENYQRLIIHEDILRVKRESGVHDLKAKFS